MGFRAVFLLGALLATLVSGVCRGSDWPYFARIATPYDYGEGLTWEEAVERAVADGANVILDWLAVSDSWKALFDPLLGRDLEEMSRRASFVHARFPGVRYLVYVAPLEYVTPGVDSDGDGRVDPEKEGESLARQHPDWLQVGIDGRKAVFYGAQPGLPFWVCASCEDTWLTPANPEYRKLVLEQARRIAATGVDGVWLDVPFLRFDFGEGWQEQWPTFDPWALARFQADTGYPVPSPPSSRWPDWDDPAWRAFVRWRYRLTRDFVAAYRAALKGVNPDIVLAVETSVGPDVSATRLGSSPLDLRGACDLMAHEVGPLWRSAAAHRYSWLSFLAKLLFFRHTDGERPSWLLSYVAAGKRDAREVARLHAGIVLAAGMNYYTSGNETMSGVPDPGFRRELFHWLAAHGKTFYGPGWTPYADVALVYSQRTMDYLDRGSWESDYSYHDGFLGMAMLLLESHIPFAVVPAEELGRLRDYRAAVFPMWAALSREGAEAIRDYVASGGTIIATGPFSLYDASGARLPDFRLADVLGVHLEKTEPGRVYVSRYGAGKAVFLYSLEADGILTPELEYFWAAAPWEGGRPDRKEAEAARGYFLEELWSRAGISPLLSTTAPPGAILIPYLGRGVLQLRAVNLHGVRRGDPVPTPLRVELSLRLPPGSHVAWARWLDFLGGWSPLSTREADGTVELSFPLSVQATVEIGLR